MSPGTSFVVAMGVIFLICLGAQLLGQTRTWKVYCALAAIGMVFLGVVYYVAVIM